MHKTRREEVRREQRGELRRRQSARCRPRRRGTGGSAPRLRRTHPVKAGGSAPNRTRCPALDPTRPRTGGIGTPPSGGETKATRGTNLRRGTRSPKRIRTRPCARVGKRIAPPSRWSFFPRHRGHPAAADCQRPWRRQLCTENCGYDGWQ
jgi:hypothetical protein